MKKSPRAGPTMADPVSCAIMRRREGRPVGRERELALEPEGQAVGPEGAIDRERAAGRQRVPAPPIGPSPGASSFASRKKM